MRRLQAHGLAAIFIIMVSACESISVARKTAPMQLTIYTEDKTAPVIPEALLSPSAGPGTMASQKVLSARELQVLDNGRAIRENPYQSLNDKDAIPYQY